MPARDEMVRKLATRGGVALRRYERLMKMGKCTPDMVMSDQASESSLLITLVDILTMLEADVNSNVVVTVRLVYKI